MDLNPRTLPRVHFGFGGISGPLHFGGSVSGERKVVKVGIASFAQFSELFDP